MTQLSSTRPRWWMTQSLVLIMLNWCVKGEQGLQGTRNCTGRDKKIRTTSRLMLRMISMRSQASFTMAKIPRIQTKLWMLKRPSLSRRDTGSSLQMLTLEHTSIDLNRKSLVDRRLSSCRKERCKGTRQPTTMLRIVIKKAVRMTKSKAMIKLRPPRKRALMMTKY